MFDGCYMEWSPSGAGLHIIGKAPNFNFDKSIYWMNNRRLWAGDTTGYASSSEADFALAGILAFW